MVRRMTTAMIPALLVMFLGSAVVSAQAQFPISGYSGGQGGASQLMTVLGVEPGKVNVRLSLAVAVGTPGDPQIPNAISLRSEANAQVTDRVLTHDKDSSFFTNKRYCAYLTGQYWGKKGTRLSDLTPSNADGCGGSISSDGHADFSFRIPDERKGQSYAQCMVLVISDGTKGVAWGGNPENSKALNIKGQPATCVAVDAKGLRAYTLDQLPDGGASIRADFAKVE